jgi:hypothetical protein
MLSQISHAVQEKTGISTCAAQVSQGRCGRKDNALSPKLVYLPSLGKGKGAGRWEIEEPLATKKI